jgi:hypothetical protein
MLSPFRTDERAALASMTGQHAIDAANNTAA